MKVNVYDLVTNRIIEQLEKGVIPWRQPWILAGNYSYARSHTTGKYYSALNQQLLGTAGEYITFRQAVKEKGRVKKGATAQKVVFWKVLKTDKTALPGQWSDADGNLLIPILKWYNVFSLTDVDGIEFKYFKPTELNHTLKPIINGERILFEYVERENIPLIFDEISDQAYYCPTTDTLKIPCLGQYQNSSEYYSTAFHETIHSTSTFKRLNRKTGKKFGDNQYAFEELVAEIGSAILCHIAGIETPQTFENSASYIASWSKRLRQDKTLIVKASTAAEKAVKYILGNLIDEIANDVDENENVD